MKCLVCGNNKFVDSIFGGYYYNDISYTLKKCKKYSLISINPIPGDKTIEDFYKENEYFIKYYPKDIDDPEHDRELGILSRIKPKGRILDVGCANGNFLRKAEKLEYDVCGIEPNMMMAEFVSRECGIKVINSNLKENLFQEDYFDIIRFSDVLEHLIDPLEALKLARSYLKADGLLFISQPLTYNKSLFSLLLAIKMFLRRNKFSNNPPYHIWEFTSPTLEKLLSKIGFNNILFKKIYETNGNAKFLNLPTKLAKNFSSFISNSQVFESLQLGNRMVIVVNKD